MSGALAGRLRAKVGLLRRDGGRDALGAAPGGWTEFATAWAAIEPLGPGAPVEGDARSALPAWRLTLRPCDVRVGNGIAWTGGTLVVRAVTADPALPDRIVVVGETQR